jgi:class 3 adenylate cyclase
MRNVISPAREWLSGIDQQTEGGEADPLAELSGLPPLKVIGDCIMFYVPKRSMAIGADALTIFSSLLNIVQVPKGVSRAVRPEVHVAVTLCERAYEVTFVKGTDDIHGKDIDLAARLVKEAGPQELVMNEAFFLDAKCVFDKWRDAGNVGGIYEEIVNVQGPWTKGFSGFKEPLEIYKWRGPRLRARSRRPAESTTST